MPHSHMVYAVIQTAILSACTLLVTRWLYASAYDSFLNNDAYRAFEAAANASTANDHSNHNLTALNGTSYNVNGTNWQITGVNQTSTTTPDSDSTDESYYWRTFPRTMCLIVLMCPLQYWWQIWLERLFPARRSMSIPFEKSEKVHGEDDETRVQEMIDKWVQQGRIKRASLNWWNTFVKWFLDITLGSLWTVAIEAVLERLLKLHTPRELFTDLKWDVLLNFVGSFFGIGPLASLLAIIIVPAHQRIVFKAGAELTWAMFFGCFMGAVIPWLAETQFMKDAVADFTAGMNSSQSAPWKVEPRLIDEL